MPTSKLFIWSLLGALSTSSIGTAGAYGLTLTTIKNYLKNDLLDEDTDDQEAWKELQKSLNSSPDVDKYSNSSLKTAQQENQGSPANGDLVKDWCKQQLDSTVNPYFNFSKYSLLSAVETFCIRTIGDKLGNNKIDYQESSTFESKIESLKNHSEDTNGVLDEYLNNLKGKDTSQSWMKLRDWCESAYKRGYSKANSNIWKLTETYCKK